MTEDLELEVDPDIIEEILRNTDRKNSISLNERLARKAMVELVKCGKATFLFIRDDESREYWSNLVKISAAKVEKRKEARRLYEIKLAAWNRLSEADRKVLGLRKPVEPRG